MVTTIRKGSLVFFIIYLVIFFLGLKALTHGFPDIERFFAEWMDERITLTDIMTFGTLNFAPKHIFHPPLYHYLTFIPISMFFIIGKLTGIFADKIEFVRLYFNNTHYFFLIGRITSYLFYWLSAIMIYKTSRLFYSKVVSHISTLSYLLIPRFIFDFSTTRPETLLFLNTSLFFYFFLKYYLDNKELKYLFLASFFLGLSTATKYNALFLGSIFIPALIFYLRNQNHIRRNYKSLLFLCFKLAFFVFLGFFIGDPFFIILFKKYIYNLSLFSRVEVKYYWEGYAPVVFLLTHIKELSSTLYFNFFGFLLLLFGSWRLFKKDKVLFTILFFVILIYEFYFGIYLSACSPLRYLNPLLPIAVLIFSAGVNYVLKYKKRFISILIIFFIILFFNYLDILIGLSLKPTYLQEARAFIEKNIPEFTNICIASNSHLPQLNMTRESYNHLIETAPRIKDIRGRELAYKEMDNNEKYESIFRELRIQSLLKKPQYNLIRWDGNIKSEQEAGAFFKKNNIRYAISNGAWMVNNKNLTDLKTVSLMKEFRPKNIKVYQGRLYLYKIELENN